MIELFLRSARINRPRYILTGLAIMAATAFMLTSLELGRYGHDAIVNSASADYGNSTAVVTPADSASDRDVTSEIAALPSVGEVYRQSTHTARVHHGGKTADFTVFNTPNEAFGFSEVISGKMPARDNQVAITQSLSTTLDLQVGDTIDVADLYFNEQDQVEESFSIPMVVTGIYAPLAPSLFLETETAGYITDAASSQWMAREGRDPGLFSSDIYVTTASGYSDAQVLSDLANISGVIVQSRTNVSNARTDQLLDSATIVSITMIIFGAFVVALTSMVIWNTFQVTMAARQRSLANLRCLGASASQVWGMILSEALLLGTLFAAVGVACGVALAKFIPNVIRVQGLAWEIPTSVTIHPQYVLIAFVTGVATTLVAAIPPGYRATARAPLAALRSGIIPAAPATPFRRRFVPGLTLMTVGIGMTVFGARITQLNLGVESAMACIGIGSLIAFTGGMLLIPLLPLVTAVPLLGVIRRLLPRGRRFSVDFTASSVRHAPRRSGSTTVGLLITTALLSGVTVMAASARTTLLANLDSVYSHDIDVIQAVSSEGYPLGISPEQVRAVEKSPYVRASLPVYEAEVRTDAERFEYTYVQAFDPSLAEDVVSDNAGPRELTRGTFLLPKTSVDHEGNLSASRETTVKVTGSNGNSIELNVEYASVKEPTMAISDLARIADPGSPSALWVSVDASQASTTHIVTDVARELNAVSGQYPPSVMSGMLRQHDTYRSATIKMTTVLFVHLIVMTLLVAMGVTNTVSLALIERRREITLMRALGQTRRGVFRSLLLEQLTLGGVGAVLGTFLGVGFSTIMVTTLFTSVSSGANVQVTWSSIALILVLELAATAALTLVSTFSTLGKRRFFVQNSRPDRA